MKLPNGERADLGSKLEEYVLNVRHPEGRHKARVFAAVLGITLDEASVLREAIQTAAANSTQAESRGDNGFGEAYVLRFAMATSKGTANILSGWIIRRGEDFPRLTTCYIL